MAHDGSIIIDVDVLTKQAEEHLEELRKIGQDSGDEISDRMKYNANKIADEWETAGEKFEEVMNDMKVVAEEMESIQITIDTEMAKPLAERDVEGLRLMRQDLAQATDEHTKLSNQSERYLRIMDLSNVRASELSQKVKEIAMAEQQTADKAISMAQAEAREIAKQNTFTGKMLQIKEQIKDTTKGIAKESKEVSKELSKSNIHSQKLGGNLKSNFRSVTKYALALFSFRSIYQTLRTLSNEWMNSDEMAARQMKANLEGIRGVLSNAIAPLVQFIGNIIMNIVGYISSFLKVFFGINIAAKQAGKNINKGIGGGLSGAKDDAKELQKILAGFDKAEVVSIQKETSSGGGGGGGIGDMDMTPSVDFSKFDALMNKIKKKIQPFIDAINSIDFKPLQKSLAELGNSFKTTFTIIGNSIANMMNNTLGPFIKMMAEDIAPRVFLAMVPVVDSLNDMLSFMLTEIVEPLFHYFMMEVVPVAFELLIGVLNVLSPIIDALLEAVEYMWLEVWQPFGLWIADTLLGILEGLAEALTDIGIEIGEDDSKLVSFFKTLMTVGTYFIVIKGIISAVTGVINILTGAWGVVTTAVKIATGAFKVVKGIVVVLTGSIGGTIAVVGALATAVAIMVTGIMTDFGRFKQGVMDIVGNIKGIFFGLIDFIAGVFTGDWSRAWSGVVSVFSNIVGGIANIFKVPINAMISGINAFIRGINRIKIPSWVPGIGGAGFNIGQIPHLAKGGVLRQPTLNVAGEYPGASSNPEIVTPQNIMLDTVRKALAEQDNNGNGDITITVPLIVDGRTLTEVTQKVSKKDLMQNNGGLRTAWT